MIAFTNQYWPETAVRFTTNGILLDEEQRERLRLLRVAAVTVSVDLWPEREEIPGSGGIFCIRPRPKRSGTWWIMAPIQIQSKNAADFASAGGGGERRGCPAVHSLRGGAFNPDRPLGADTIVSGESSQASSWEREQQLLSELRRIGRERGVSVRTLNQQSFPLRLATHFDGICARTDDSLYITVEGTITPCCNLREYAIGSLDPPGMTLAEAWNSKRENEFFDNQRPVCGLCDALFHGYRA